MEVYAAGKPPAGLLGLPSFEAVNLVLSGPSAHIIWASSKELIVTIDGKVEIFTALGRLNLAPSHPFSAAPTGKISCFGDNDLGLFGFISNGITYLTKGIIGASGIQASIELPQRANLAASHIAISGDARVVVVKSKSSRTAPIELLQFDHFNKDTFALFTAKFEQEPYRSHQQFIKLTPASFVDYLTDSSGAEDLGSHPRHFTIPSPDADVKQLVADDDSFSLLLNSGKVYTWTHEGRDFGLGRTVEDMDTYTPDEEIAALAAAPALADVTLQTAGRCVQLAAAGPVTIAVTSEMNATHATIDASTILPPGTPSEAYLWGPLSQSVPTPTGIPPWLMSEMGYAIFTQTFDEVNLLARQNGNERDGSSMAPESERSLVMMASVAPRHCAVLDAQGEVWTVGDNAFGQLGRNIGEEARDKFWGVVHDPPVGEVVQIVCSGTATYFVVKK